jgi:hypothetical protein
MQRNANTFAVGSKDMQRNVNTFAVVRGCRQP